MRHIALILLTASLLCACGQTGSLYLPDDEREEVGAPAAAPAPAATATPDAAPATPTPEERERENAARNSRGN